MSGLTGIKVSNLPQVTPTANDTLYDIQAGASSKITVGSLNAVFVDNVSAQAIAGAKTFSALATFSAGISTSGLTLSGGSLVLPANTVIGNNASSSNVLIFGTSNQAMFFDF